MTRKQKELKYRQASKLVRSGMSMYYCTSEVGIYGERTEMEMFETIEYFNDLKETILLSCAELVRLNFELK